MSKQLRERILDAAEGYMTGLHDGRARGVSDVRLRREGAENDPHARAVVSINRNGEWVDVISEPLSACFDHFVNVE